MQTLLIYTWAMMASLLPHRYRSRLSIHGSDELWLGAILSGAAQTIAFGLILLLRFMQQISGYMGDAGSVVLESQRGLTMDVMQVRLATGVLGLLSFAVQPSNMAILYLTAEGAVRTLAALTAEVLPTMPLVVALHDRLVARNFWTMGRTLPGLQYIMSRINSMVFSSEKFKADSRTTQQFS